MNVHEFLNYRMEKTAGAKRLQRLFNKGNKLVARGEEVPESLLTAANTSAAKLRRRAERNPEYNEELLKRFDSSFGSEAKRSRFLSDVATGFNKKRGRFGSFSILKRDDGKMVLPKNLKLNPKYLK